MTMLMYLGKWSDKNVYYKVKNKYKYVYFKQTIHLISTQTLCNKQMCVILYIQIKLPTCNNHRLLYILLNITDFYCKVQKFSTTDESMQQNGNGLWHDTI